MDQEKLNKFILLRAQGKSFNKIAAELGVTKQTLISWSRQYATEIKNEKALEMESLREQFNLARRHRLKIMGVQLNQVTQEILNRDYSEVPTWRLFEMQRKILNEIEMDPGEISLQEETVINSTEAIKDLLTRKLKWTC